jgi:microcystin-dependent protein
LSSPYVGEIRIFAGNFAPAGWHFCDGSLMAISENETLFNLIGTTYGGDGQQTFALPNLAGRIPVHNGTNPGTGTTFSLGELAGTETVTLTTNQIPGHTHPFVASADPASTANPANQMLASSSQINMYFEGTPGVNLNTLSSGSAGGSQPHDNLQPFLTISFIISLFGIYPTQS